MNINPTQSTIRTLSKIFAHSVWVVFAAVAMADPQYQIYDLGVVQVDHFALSGYGISPGGIGLGSSFSGNGQEFTGSQAFTWTQGGSLVGLPNLAGRNFCISRSANGRIVVGSCPTSESPNLGDELPVIWQHGVVSQLPLPAGYTIGAAHSVNASGIAVGSVGNAGSQRGVIYTGKNAGIITQTTPGGSFFTVAYGINDSGRIAGRGSDNLGIVHDTATNTTFSIGAFQGAGNSIAYGVNNSGSVVGWSFPLPHSVIGLPFIWSEATGMVAIPVVQGTEGGGGSALAMNSDGWVVGKIFSDPFLYDRTDVYRLADLLPAGSGWNLASAAGSLGISDNGTIIGTGRHNNQTRAYAMVPLPSTPTPTPTGTPAPTAPPTTTHFVISAPFSSGRGSSLGIAVSARDQFNHTAVGYTGTVHFTSTSSGILPPNRTLTNGTGFFAVTLNTPGDQTITATDTSNSSITGTSNSVFVPPPATPFARVTPTATNTATPTPTATASPTPTATVAPTPTPCANYISTGGTATIVPGTVDIGNHTNDGTTAITLPFGFRFYGTPFTTANVSSNGNLQFNSNNTAFSNVCLPTSTMNNLISPFWDDLRTDSTGGGIFTSISGTCPNRTFNIEWRAIYFGTTTTLNFEIRLYEETGQIDFIYGTMNSGSSSATIGMQRDLGSAFNQFSCNTPVSDGSKITWTNACPTVTPTCPTPSPTPTVTATAAATPTPTPCLPVITQSSSQAITNGNSASCNDGTAHTDNSYWRAFDMVAYANGGQYFVNSVSFGVEFANTYQPVTVRLYTTSDFPTGFPGSLTQIGTTTTNVSSAQNGTVVTTPLVATVPAGTPQLVMELFTPNGQPWGFRFFVGSNAALETGPSYFSAPVCGITTPATTAASGFPDMHIVFNVNGSCTGPTPTPSATPSTTPTPGPSTAPPAEPLNLSTRMLVKTDDNAGIGGFILTGRGPGTPQTRVMVRAIGPSLTQFGVPNALADPTIELHGPGGLVAFNDNWQNGGCGCHIGDYCMNPLPTNDLESAICGWFDPGPYTVIIRGRDGTSGIGLVEVYHNGSAVPPYPAGKLANLSTRAFVSTDSDIVIAGFILGVNTGNDNVILRGLGPSLTQFGVPNALVNPTLELHDSNGALIRANNDWQDDPAQAAIISAAGLAPTNALESALAATLPAGQYTALLAGLNNGTGVGLVEFYDTGRP